MLEDWDGTEAEALDDALDIAESRADLMRFLMRGRQVTPYAKYETAKSAKVGDKIECPSCGKTMSKKSYQHVFCSNKGYRNCKDTYWNYAKPERMERIRAAHTGSNKFTYKG